MDVPPDLPDLPEPPETAERTDLPETTDALEPTESHSWSPTASPEDASSALLDALDLVDPKDNLGLLDSLDSPEDVSAPLFTF